MKSSHWAQRKLALLKAGCTGLCLIKSIFRNTVELVDHVAQLILVSYQRMFSQKNTRVSLTLKSVRVLDACLSLLTNPLSRVINLVRFLAGALIHPSLALYDGMAPENQQPFSEYLFYLRSRKLHAENFSGRLGMDVEGNDLTIEESDRVVQDFLELYHACKTPEERIEFLRTICVVAKNNWDSSLPSPYEKSRERYLIKKYIKEFIQTGEMNTLAEADKNFVIRYGHFYWYQNTFDDIQQSIPRLLEANRLPQLLAYFNKHQALDSRVSEVEAINQLNCGFELIPSGSALTMKFTTQEVTLTQWMLSLACIRKYQIADIEFNGATSILMNISYESLKEAKSIRISHPSNHALDFYDHKRCKKFSRLEHLEIDFCHKSTLAHLKDFESVSPNLLTLRYKNLPYKIKDVIRIDDMLKSCPRLMEVELPLDPELLATCQATYPNIRWISNLS